MLGRSARGNRKPGPDYPTETRSPHRSAYNRRRSGPRHRRTKRKRDRPYRHYPRYPSHCGGCPQQALEAITKGNEAERGQGQFTTLRVSEGKARERSLPSGSQSLQTINCELCILNCELTLSRLRGKLEYATGGNAERWREKVFGPAMAYRAKHRLQPCEPKPRHAEARRIYKSPFLTGLAPRTSAREHLRHRSTASDKKPVPVSLPNQNHKLAAARATLRIAKPQNDKKRRSNNRPQTTIPYQSSCAITPPADC